MDGQPRDNRQQQQQQQQDPNRNAPDPRINPNGRLQLNFGFQNDPNFAADVGRAFPTTPSTFPQPVFPNQYGQRETWGTQQQTPNAYGGSNYFVNNAQPPQLQPQYQQQNLQAPTAAYRSPGGYNDGTNGLVHQFSHQNLGGGNTPRSASPYARQPSPAGAPTAGSRPRTAGNAGTSPQQQPQQQQYGSHLAAHAAPSQSPGPDEDLPPKNPEKYADVVYRRSKATQELVGTFFKENVQRARDRNQRTKDFDQYLQDRTISEAKKVSKRIALEKSEAQFLRFLRTKEKASNFATVKIIGKGAFGEVKLVQKKSDGKIFALKSLVKSEMVKRDQLAHVRSERDILAESDSPWIVKLHTTFQDSTFLYMLMEFLPGGDLMTMLIKYDQFSDDITRFYMAELISAIEVVHNHGFIHRDIKPDNILLDRGGHVKLTDFGLSTGFHKEHDQSYYQQLIHGKPKSNPNRNSVAFDQIQLTVTKREVAKTWRQSRRRLAFSTVGTPDYIAPEIFTGKGYDYSCDWWSVGTIMFECLVGWPPFCAEESNETYRKIVDWPRHLHFPPDQPLNKEPEDFIRKLICNPEDRLGRLGGATEIKKHPFFRGVDFGALRQVRAPFEPRLSSNIDTQYFPIDEIPQQDNSAAIRAKDLAAGNDEQEMNLPFIGYTFRRFDAFRSS